MAKNRRVIRKPILQEDTGMVCTWGEVYARDARLSTGVYVAHYFSSEAAARSMPNGYGQVRKCTVEAG